MSIQRPSYDKTSLGFLINMSTKKLEIRSDVKEKDKSNDNIESSQSTEKPKEIDQINEVEILDEPKQVETTKTTRYEFRGKCFLCNAIGHMKRDCTNKSFNHFKKFYCHNCHGMGHNAIDCRKPKYDNCRSDSRMSRYTNPADKRRSNERISKQKIL